jgi:hypothetical protein
MQSQCFAHIAVDFGQLWADGNRPLVACQRISDGPFAQQDIPQADVGPSVAGRQLYRALVLYNRLGTLALRGENPGKIGLGGLT